MGRPIELMHLDPQGDNARYQEFARRLLQRDKVDVLIGGITSASREAIRPIVDRLNAFYIYTNQYEGGVCDGNMLSVGAVPEQQLSTLLPWMVEKFGKKVYTVAADYNFGHLSAEWGDQILKPLGVRDRRRGIHPARRVAVRPRPSRTSSAPSRTGSTCWTLAPRRARSTSRRTPPACNLPMASPIKIMLGFEHKRFPPGVMNGMYAAANWFEELDTPAAEDFKKRWRAKFPHEVYINDMGYNAYVAIYMYKMLVERAKSTSKDAIRKVMATGDAGIDAPEGRDHHRPEKPALLARACGLIEVDAQNQVHVHQGFRHHPALLAGPR